MPIDTRPLLLLVLALVTGTELHAQAQWSQVGAASGNPPGRLRAELFFDATRGAIVLFGHPPENDMWQWDGTTWTEITPASRPAEGGTLAYDTARSRAVLFTQPSGSTWEWDGTTWTQRATPVAPPPRSDAAMAYDAARGRVVLFGGGGPQLATDDTWLWDGTAWTQSTPAQSPSPRTYTSMAYDEARQRVVLFGGLRYTWHDDTWEWDGVTWMQRVAPGPPPTYGHKTAYDAARQRIVVLAASGTWEWDGSAWQQRAPASSGPARSGAGYAYDRVRQRIVLFGGLGLDQTWEWDGVRWVERTIRTRPAPRIDDGLAYDAARGETILFGGNDETWRWDGTAWSEIPTAVQPPGARYGHAMAYDAARARVVLFGGATGVGSFFDHLDDTWEWDGTRWLALDPATRPSPRSYAAMFFDAARGRLLLHGGQRDWALRQSSETWEWDGTTWTLLASGPPATARSGHSVAYDSARGRQMMFGGRRWDMGAEQNVSLADSWEWDGAAWSFVQPAVVPPARDGHAMVYDAFRDRIVLVAGDATTVSGSGTSYTDTWEYADGSWTLAHPISPGGTITGHRAVFDAARSAVVVFGGWNSYRALDETWSYATPFPAGYTPFGAGCAGTAEVPSLAPAPRALPWFGAPFDLALRSVSSELPLALVLGSSRTQWLGSSLPLSLTGLGMTGCTLYIGIDLVLPAPTLRAPQWTLPIPEQPALIGASVYCQAFALDPRVPGGAFWSDAGEARIGVR